MNVQKQLLRKIPISKRIALLVLLVSILPTVAMGVFVYFQSGKAIRMVAASYNQKLVETIKQNIDLRLQAFIDLSDELILTATVRDTLDSYEKMNSSQKYWAAQNIYSEVRSKYTRITDICDIRIVTAKNIPVYSTGFLYLDSAQDEQNFERIAQHSDSMLWYNIKYDDKPYLILSRKITNLSSKEPLGYIIIHINADVLEDLYSNFNLNQNSYITLLDSFGGTLAKAGTLTDENQTVFHDILSLEKSEDIVQYRESRADFIYYSTIQKLGLTLVTSIPYSALISSIQSILFATCIFMLVCILLSVVISRYIWKSVSSPLNKLVAYIKDTSDMRFHTDLIDDSSDELGFMAQAYNRIVKILKNMVAQVKQEQEEKRKSEIKLLQAQINPHFLFNTLDSLRFTAMMSQADTVSEGLSSLSHILRNSIIDDKPYIKISEEIKCVEDYIAIQKIRYGDFIALHKQIEEEVSDCLIMKFLLQPIVENSIVHGMQKKDAIDITITAKRIENQTEIVIADNGNGFDMEERIDKKTNVIKSSKLSGIGLENVKQRLELEFGKEQSFTINGRKGAGTTVVMRYPLKRHPLGPPEEPAIPHDSEVT